jgi:LysM repeat protein
MVAGPETRQIVVEDGQSISRIAVRYRVPKAAIIAANRLEPPYKIKIGQRLVIPGSSDPAPVRASEARQIVVEEGQSISRIAAKYRAPEAAIIEANHLTPPYKLKVGQRLVMPGPKEATAPVVVASRAPEPIPLDDPAPQAATGSAPAAQPQAEASLGSTAASVAAEPAPPPMPVAAEPVPPMAAAAAPAGATCPPGRTGAWSTDIIRQPVYICR